METAASSSPHQETTAAHPITLSDAWKQLYFSSPSHPSSSTFSRLPSSTPQADADDSSDDGFLSDHTDDLHPETGFDPFLSASRRAREQTSSSSVNQGASTTNLLSASESSSSSPATSESILRTNSDQKKDHSAGQHEQRWNQIATYWSKVVDDVMLRPKQAPIDLSDKHITHILPTIADLSRYVALPPPRYDNAPSTQQPQASSTLLQSKSGGLVRHESYLPPFSANLHNDASAFGNRSFSRSQSAYQPSLNNRTNSFARTTSAMSTLSSRSAGSYRDPRDSQATLSIFLGSNLLTKLPSALFQLQNLRVLSLRSNKLQFLPSAIGDLQNLTELHIHNNQLQYLPAEILRLHLQVFTWFPNPFLVKPPSNGILTVRPLLCHKARHTRQQALQKLSEEAEDSTPVRAADLEDANSALIQPPPLIRASATVSAASRQRPMDRTRSEMQVEGFLARGIDQLGRGTFDSIHEQEDDNEDTFTADSSLSSVASTVTDVEATLPAQAPPPIDEDEAQRQRVLEAAFAEDDFTEPVLTPTDDGAQDLGKVSGRSRVLGPKQLGDMPSLQELCIRKLLEPYDVAEGEAEGIMSPFLSPVVQSSDGSKRRRSGSRTGSRISTPSFGPSHRARVSSFGSTGTRTRSFSSNGGPEDSKFGKRIPTLLEAYENGTLQSLVGELGRGIVPMLEAARRSATQDWGTKARMRRTTSARKNPFARTQSAVGSFPSGSLDESKAGIASSEDANAAETEVDEEAYDPFGGVEAPGSLDRGDDACQNPWFSRCPNPKHCVECSSANAASSRRRGDLSLQRNRKGFGSSSSVSSLGTTLGGGKAWSSSVDMEREHSTAASSDGGGGHSPISQSSSIGTLGGFGTNTSSSSLSSQRVDSRGLPDDAPHVRFMQLGRSAAAGIDQRGSSSFSRSPSASSSLFAGGASASRVMTRPHSTNFVRGFSISSALSASGLRSTSFAATEVGGGAGAMGGNNIVERDWPLTEQEHRQAPVFCKPVETRIEWISHIGGVKVAKLNDAQVDLSQQSVGGGEALDAEGRPSQSMLGAMGGFENKDLIPILWRGCSKGCLDFLV